MAKDTRTQIQELMTAGKFWLAGEATLDQAVAHWPAMYGDATPRQLAHDFLYTHGMTLGIDTRTRAEGNHRSAQLHIHHPAMRGGDAAVFRFDLEHHKATFENACLEPGKQRKGITRTLLRHCVEWTERHGIDSFSVGHANEVGSYLWAKCGATPTAEGWERLKPALQARWQEILLHDDIPDYGRRAMEEMLASAEPADIGFLADFANPKVHTPEAIKKYVQADEREHIGLGKALLIGQEWDGALDLTNPEAKQKFYSYAKRGRDQHVAASHSHVSGEIHRA